MPDALTNWARVMCRHGIIRPKTTVDNLWWVVGDIPVRRLLFLCVDHKAPVVRSVGNSLERYTTLLLPFVHTGGEAWQPCWKDLMNRKVISHVVYWIPKGRLTRYLSSQGSRAVTADTALPATSSLHQRRRRASKPVLNPYLWVVQIGKGAVKYRICDL